jgi:hypothetical protein
MKRLSAAAGRKIAIVNSRLRLPARPSSGEAADESPARTIPMPISGELDYSFEMIKEPV